MVRGFTDIQRAAKFFLLIRTSFGADRRSFGCSSNGRSIAGAVEYLSQVQKRLESVVIENRDFEALIKTYDRPGALFYLDPPYHGTEDYYDAAFSNKDHERLCERLKQIKGRFVLSYNDDEYIRELYKDFTLEAVERQNNMSTGKYKELIIRNY